MVKQHQMVNIGLLEIREFCVISTVTCHNTCRWGSGWGEGGYLRIRRGVNMCGIELMPAFPKL